MSIHTPAINGTTVTDVNKQIRSWSSTEDRALKILGNGYSPAVAATAVGVTEARISQLLADEAFASAVVELRFNSLQKYNELDDAYDVIESKLIKQLDDILPLIMRPADILRAIAVINTAKRRGNSSNENVTQQATVVNLTMPTLIMQKFTTNINNQVIQAGNQTLETMQSSSMLDAAKRRAGERNNDNSDPSLQFQGIKTLTGGS